MPAKRDVRGRLFDTDIKNERGERGHACSDSELGHRGLLRDQNMTTNIYEREMRAFIASRPSDYAFLSPWEKKGTRKIRHDIGG